MVYQWSSNQIPAGIMPHSPSMTFVNIAWLSQTPVSCQSDRVICHNINKVTEHPCSHDATVYSTVTCMTFEQTHTPWYFMAPYAIKEHNIIYVFSIRFSFQILLFHCVCKYFTVVIKVQLKLWVVESGLIGSGKDTVGRLFWADPTVFLGGC